jgi:hypothetical protein
MVYPTHSTYLTWGGYIGEGSEDSWQVGVHLAPTAPSTAAFMPSPTQLGTLAEGALRTFHTSDNAQASHLVKLNWAKAAPLDFNGHYSGEAVTYNLATPMPGHYEGDQRSAPQVACAITLWSGQRLGHANYGRLYYPMWSATLSEYGYVIDSHAGLMADQAKILIDGINSWADSIFTATDVAVTILSKVGLGAMKRPSAIRIGNVKDTQQRRRRQLREAYTNRTLA